MLYEGTFEVYKDTAQIDLTPQNNSDSQYNFQMDNDTSNLDKIFSVLNPFFDPDEEPEDAHSYAQNLKKKGYGSFYTSDQNIQDLINMYSNTQKKEINPFPGIDSPRSHNEIIVTETIKNFSGYINETIINNKKIVFSYRGVI